MNRLFSQYHHALLIKRVLKFVLSEKQKQNKTFDYNWFSTTKNFLPSLCMEAAIAKTYEGEWHQNLVI
jgi:hypothetical protein